jgi:putative Holliday junction resolvase
MFFFIGSTLLLLAVTSDAFFTPSSLKSTTFFVSSKATTKSRTFRLLSSMRDEIEAAASGSNDNVMSDLMKAAAAVTLESCRILGVKSVGVDYGLVRTGVAATVGYDPKPLAILSDLNSTQVCQQVIQIARAEQASRIILGLPVHKNGTEAEQTTLTRIFASELSQMVLQKLGPKVPVYFWDERYTSKEAAARAHSRDPNRELWGQLDAEAACIILENYYLDNGLGADQVPVPAEMLEHYTRLYEEHESQAGQRLQSILDEREERIRRRKEVMARDRQLELEQSANGSSSSKKKKKKKREKRGPWIVPGEATQLPTNPDG